MRSGLLLVLAGFSMAVALACQNVTVAGGNYRHVLVTALGAMLVADACGVIVFRRGGRLRWVAATLALPSLFILWDLLRRAPHVWGFA